MILEFFSFQLSLIVNPNLELEHIESLDASTTDLDIQVLEEVGASAVPGKLTDSEPEDSGSSIELVEKIKNETTNTAEVTLFQWTL